MDKKTIMTVMEEEYNNNLNILNFNNSNLMMKLCLTTEHFVRSFEYPLPLESGVKSKIINCIKKVIIKSTRFLTKPYADKMQTYNDSLCELLGEMIVNYEKEFNDMEQQILSLYRENEQLRYYVENMQKNIETRKQK